MATPFLGELKVISWNFAPKGWAFCNGQTLPINQNQALFSLLGTTFGGDGRTTFGLPNLQGRTPLHFGSGITLGALGGEANHTLVTTEMPTHNHQANGTTTADTLASPSGSFWGTGGLISYNGAAPNSAMSGAAISFTGGNQAHNNMQPYLVLNIIIALSGIFPSQN